MSMEEDIKIALEYAMSGSDERMDKCFLAGAAHGRKAERERIWEALPDDLNDIPSGDLKQIIFGGEGEKDKEE